MQYFLRFLKSIYVLIFILGLSASVICKAKAVSYQHQSSVEVFAKKADLNPKVLNLALKAHTNAKRKGITKSNLMTVIDYSLPSTQKRLWVIDIDKNKVVYHTHVAHGSGSGDKYSRSFSNHHNTHKSSIGLFVTGSTYQGKHGRSLNLHGLEQGINNNAYARRIVIHSAKYVGEHIVQRQGRLGRSHGCPALSPKVADPIINTIKNGVLLFSYYPEPTWLKNSRFL